MLSTPPHTRSATNLATIRDWLGRFAECVRAADFTAARTMFSDDVASFGTWTVLMEGLDTLEREQWLNVWPRTCGFAFDPTPIAADLDGDCGWVAATWSSQKLNADGTPGIARSGRATITFRRAADASLIATHTHFSFDPTGTLLPPTGTGPRG